MKITSGKIEKAQKVVVFGPEGIGKSTFGSRFPDPLFSDTEGSTVHLDVKRFEKPTSWAMLMAQAEYVKINKPCKTYVIDTADWAEKLAKEHVIATNPKFKSIEDFGYGKGYTILSEEWGRWLNKLQEVADAGINVVILAHAFTRKFELPDEVGTYDRWELKLEKKTAPLTKEWADAVLFANYEIYVENVDGQGATKGKNKARGGERVMYTSHHPAWDGKNRWGLQEKLRFSYKEIEAHIPVIGDAVQEKPTVEKKTAPVQDKPQGKTAPVQETVQTEAVDTRIDKLPKAIQDLMKQQGITSDDLEIYISKIKGHFPAGTPFENLPEDYLKGIAANWYKIVQDIRDYHGPVKLDITDDSLTY